MNYKTNYHTHTVYCDGNDTPEEMVQTAIEKGFDILGFSGHSMYPFGELWHISPKEHDSYVTEIKRLKEKYSDRLQILLGFEADYIPSLCDPSFKRFETFNPDFLIGSVHYVVNEKGFMTVDDSVENVKSGLDTVFNGNGKKLVQEYFYLQREMLKNCSFNILGHFDLVRKRNDILKFFDENDSWYRKEIKLLVKEIEKSGVIAEVNTGAIARGAMKDVYPSLFALEEMKKRNIPVTITSDCHSKNQLDAAFDYAKDQLLKAGYTETAVLLKNNSSDKISIITQPLK